MNQGAAKHALRYRANDLYETPVICTVAACRAGVFSGLIGKTIWEPAAGRGAMVRVLRSHGIYCIATDLVAYPDADLGIQSQRDFLMEYTAPKNVAAIITNPPFKNADAFVRHGLSLGLRVIVLLRAMAIEGAGRADLIDGHLTDYWIGIDRPPAMHRDGWQGNKLTNSGAPFAWYDFSPDKRPSQQPIRLHRFYWNESKRKAAA